MSDDQERDEIDNTVCFDFHENLEMHSVRKLKFKLYNEMCTECFLMLLESFPNVEHLELIAAVSTEQFCNLVEKYPKLKSLKLFCGNVSNFYFFIFDCR